MLTERLKLSWSERFPVTPSVKAYLLGARNHRQTAILIGPESGRFKCPRCPSHIQVNCNSVFIQLTRRCVKQEPTSSEVAQAAVPPEVTVPGEASVEREPINADAEEDEDGTGGII